jgi:hypothetical protein
VAFAAEAQAAVHLASLEARGAELCSTLYTYRSISRALPPASGDEVRRRAMYGASFTVLHEQLLRVNALLSFKAEAVGCFCDSLALCAPPGAAAPARPTAAGARVGAGVGGSCVHMSGVGSSGGGGVGGGGSGGGLALIPSLIGLFDTLLVLDCIKDVKACLVNDLASYKRVRDEGPHPHGHAREQPPSPPPHPHTHSPAPHTQEDPPP